MNNSWRKVVNMQRYIVYKLKHFFHDSHYLHSLCWSRSLRRYCGRIYVQLFSFSNLQQSDYRAPLPATEHDAVQLGAVLAAVCARRRQLRENFHGVGANLAVHSRRRDTGEFV